jgi:hypothetical protein
MTPKTHTITFEVKADTSDLEAKCATIARALRRKRSLWAQTLDLLLIVGSMTAATLGVIDHDPFQMSYATLLAVMVLL